MNYHKIDYDDMLNGEGLRVVLYVSGCNHHCEGCQNPQTWDLYSGIKFDTNAKEEIYKYLSKDYTSGITISGGDPLCISNVRNVRNLCADIKSDFKDKTIWVYTGYTIEQILKDKILKSALEFIDVLVDGRFIEELADRNYYWAGSTNQKIIDVQKTLNSGEVVLYKV